MKKYILIFAALFAASAWATNYTEPTPVKSDPIYLTSNPSAQAGAGSESTSNAVGGNVGNITTGGATASLTGGNSSATGGTGGSSSIGSVTGGAGGLGGQGGDSTSSATGGNSTSAGGSAISGSSSAETYSATGDVNNTITGGASSSKYLSVGLPAPVWTSVPTPFGCLVSESTAGAAGWNFVSGSKSKQFSDVVCTTIRMAEAAYLHCQYETAAYLNKRVFETMHGGDGGFFLASAPKNLSPVECDDLKRPKLQMAPSIAPPQHITVAPVITSTQAEQKPAACRAPTPRKPVVKRKTPTCVNCCKG